jgi:hypothetical protein
MWHYYGKLSSSAENPWVPYPMKLGENKLETFSSGYGVVFDGDTMHAGAVYNADQCNIDIRSKSIKNGLVYKNDSNYSVKNTKYYNLRLHLEVDTKVASNTGSGFSKKRCDFMKDLIKCTD